jgi:hypothetical protein
LRVSHHCAAFQFSPVPADTDSNTGSHWKRVYHIQIATTLIEVSHARGQMGAGSHIHYFRGRRKGMPFVLSPVIHGSPSLEALVGGVQDADALKTLAARFAESSFIVKGEYNGSLNF